MIQPKLVTDIKSAMHAYTASTPGFAYRESQRQMIHAIFDTLKNVYIDIRPDDYTTPISVIEAGTGVGKTLGYLTAALPAALMLNKKLVLSTATVALQEQLVNKDLPDVQRKFPHAFTFTILKGRQRYVCPSLLEKQLHATNDMFVDMAEEEANAYKDLASAFSSTWSGDRDELEEAVKDKYWQKVSTSSTGCAGRLCSNYYRCPFYKARQDANKADVLVANHDLILSSLSHESSSLPPLEEAIVVFDESHHLTDKARSHLSHQHRFKGVQTQIDKGLKHLAEISNDLQIAGSTMDLLETVKEGVQLILTQHEQYIREVGDFKSQGPQDNTTQVWLLNHSELPVALQAGALGLCNLAEKGLEALADIRSTMMSSAKKDDKKALIAETYLPRLAALEGTLNNLAMTWRPFKQGYEENQPQARWFEMHEGTQPELSAHSTPVSSAKMLLESLWSKAAACVLTSATLRSLGCFERFLKKSGLKDYPSLITCSLASPFDYQRNGQLVFPRMTSMPDQRDAFTSEVSQWMETNIDAKEGTLILFTSYWQLEAVYASMDLGFKRRCLSQAKLSKADIIKKHKERIKKGKGSIILGVASMSEGLDLPGKYLTHVVITKVPFAVPTDPVSVTEAEWISAQGRQPFFEISVPDASIAMVQAVGRLIRTESDCGKVSILDRRLLTRGYGKRICQDLPNMTQVIL